MTDAKSATEMHGKNQDILLIFSYLGKVKSLWEPFDIFYDLQEFSPIGAYFWQFYNF